MEDVCHRRRLLTSQYERCRGEGSGTPRPEAKVALEYTGSLWIRIYETLNQQSTLNVILANLFEDMSVCSVAEPDANPKHTAHVGDGWQKICEHRLDQSIIALRHGCIHAQVRCSRKEHQRGAADVSLLRERLASSASATTCYVDAFA